MKTKSYVLLAAAVSVPLVLTGCQTTGAGGVFSNDCKIAGAGIGAVVGGVAAGLLLGKGNGKILTALAGMAAGAVIGQQIGSLLDCQDQQAAAVTTQQAGEAKTGEKLYWSTPAAEAKVADAQKQDATQTAAAEAEKAKVAAAAPAKPVKKPAAKPKPPTTTADAKSDPWAVKEPAPATAATPAASNGAWTVREPVRSAGSSGMWGWSEPVGDATRQADGRTCRSLKQVVVDANGARREETVQSCLNDQQQWVVASR